MFRDAMSKNTTHYKEIVIGSGLPAVMYSFFNSTPLIFKKTRKPEVFETFDPRYKLKYTKKLEGLFDFTKTQQEVWTKIIFALQGAGLITSNEYTLSLRIDTTNKEIKVVTYKAGLVTFTYDKLIIFEDEDLQGLPVPIQRLDEFQVIDWFRVKSCGPHSASYIKGTDKFINEVHFVEFSATRRPNSLAAISYLTLSQMMSFDFSDTMAKFKIQEMMKKEGIKGPKNGEDPSNPGEHRYGPIKLESAYRKMWRRDMHLYPPVDGVEFYNTDALGVIMNSKLDKESYQYKLYKMINGTGGE